MRITSLFGIVLLSVMSVAVAGDKAKLSPKAESARVKYEAACAKAKAAYEKALADAAKPYRAALEQSVKEATKSGDFDTAMAAKAEIEALGDPTVSTGKSFTAVVPAKKRWTKIGPVKKGQHLRFTSSGEWTPVKGSEMFGGKGINGFAVLVGKVDDGDEFVVGETSEIEIEDNGTLFLGCRDSLMDDNDGELAVTIEQLR